MNRRGTAVIITFGPFAGLTATIVSSRLKRVVVRVILRHKLSILLELDEDMIERARDHATEVRATSL